MALTDLTRISTSGIATGTSLSGAILHGDAHFRGTQVGVNSAIFDSSDDALELNDNVKLKFGNDGDLKLYHNGSHSFIDETGAGNLYIRNGAKNSIWCQTDGQVNLYHNDVKKFETAETGAVVTGILTATSFSGLILGSPINNPSGISTFYDLRVVNNLTVEGTTTTLDTNLIGVDRVEVGANSNTVTGIAVTQSGTADIVRLYDGASQVVTVDDEGKVGLGTDTPQFTLDANGEIASKNPANLEFIGLHLTSNEARIRSSFYSGKSGAYRPITFFTSDEERLRIAADGKVGIGTDVPASNLQVDGTSLTLINKVDTANTFITVENAGSGNAGVKMHNSNGEWTVIANDRLRIMDEDGGGVERVTIASNGRVGIGSEIPAQKLDVNGNIRSSVLYLDRHGSPTINMTSTSDTGGGSIYFGSPASGLRGGILYNHDGDILKLRNIYGTSIEIDNSRKAKFYGDMHMLKGSGQPAATLTLQTHDTANSIAKINLMARDNSNNNETCYIEANSGSTETVDLRFGTSGGEKLRITSDGQVIVNGTDNLAHPNMDDIIVGNASGNRGITIASGSGTNFGSIAFGDSTDGSGADRYEGLIEYYHGDNSLTFYTSHTAKLRIDTDGRILTGGETGTNVTPGGIHVKTSNGAATTQALVLVNAANNANTEVQIKMVASAASPDDRYNAINCVNVAGNNRMDTVFVTCPGGTPQERMRIDNEGRLLIGYTANVVRHEAQNAALQISGTARDDSSAAIGRWSTDANPARLEFSKSRNATIGNHTAVAADDEIGHINFSGSDGTRYLGAAFIKGIATTPIADYDCAGYLSFGTNYGTTSPSERVRITEDGYVHLGNTAHGTNKVGGQAITGQDYDPVVKVYSSGSNNWLAQLRSDHTSGNGIFLRAGNSSSTYTLYATGYDENNPHLVVRGDGKVGIGEDDPDGNQLLIRGASTFQTNKGHIMLTGDSATVGQGPQIVFSESGSTTSYAGAYIGHVRQGSNSVGDLAFGTRGVTGDANTVPTERLRIKDTGSVIIYRSPSTTSGGYATLEHMESNALRTHTRYISAGGSSATINLMRVRRHYWGAGFYKIWLKQVYYVATNEAVWWVNGHGRNTGGYTPTWSLGHEDKNGSIGSSVISHTTSSNSSPGNDYAQYIDIYATVAAYHHYVVHIEAMGSVSYSTNTSSVSENGYALF